MIDHVTKYGQEHAQDEDHRECINPIHCITVMECCFDCVAWRCGFSIRVHSRNAKSIHLGSQEREHETLPQ